jgi:hypothetical protein
MEVLNSTPQAPAAGGELHGCIRARCCWRIAPWLEGHSRRPSSPLQNLRQSPSPYSRLPPIPLLPTPKTVVCWPGLCLATQLHDRHCCGTSVVHRHRRLVSPANSAPTKSRSSSMLDIGVYDFHMEGLL